MEKGVRITAIFGIVAIMVSGGVSAARHEEIYIICPITWCMGAGNVIQWLGLASWGLGVLLVFLCLLLSLHGLLGSIAVSVSVIFMPRSRLLLQLGALAYITLSFAIGCPLYLIFTDPRLRHLMRNASGPPLSESYAILPVLFLVTGLLLYSFSKTLREIPSPQRP